MSSFNLSADVWNQQEQNDALSLKGPILVIGASGFVGSKLFFSLSRLRGDVFAASRNILASWRFVNKDHSIQNRQLLNLDIGNYQNLSTVLQKIKPRTIFNLSAYGAYERQSDFAQIHRVNYWGTLNLVRILQELGCDAFVQAGSSSEYGLNCTAPLEESQLKPNSDYAVSKGAASLLVSYYGGITGLPCAHLRLYSVYGPFEEKDRLIPRLVEAGIKGKFPPFADKHISRDFLYVDDCTRAFVKAALTVCKSEPGLSLNVGTGKRTTLEEVAQTAGKVFGISEPPSFGTMSNRKWDLSNWYSNSTQATHKMDWSARVSFEEGLRLTKAWEEHSAKVFTYSAPPAASKKLSAIIACYRDHQAIPIMHERLTKAFQSIGVDYEIIFVNDRSPTTDENEIRNLCMTDHHTLGISHSRNFGSQSAFLSGIGIATGDAMILLDGDLQDPPDLIPEFFKRWQEGYDIVYGVRTRRETSWLMQVFYKLFYRIFRKLSDIEIPLDAGDFSLIDARVARELLKLPEKDVFLRGLRAWVGFKQTGVPYERPERMFGRTTNSFSKNIWWAKKAIFSFSMKPLYYIQGLGATFFAVSGLLTLLYLGFYFLSPESAPPGITTIILLILGIGGLQLLSISVLGDYLGKVLEEVKNRPRFIRSKIFQGKEVYETPDQVEEFLISLKESK
ncbi:NAD-dependent epimerase/dehydratase family protein [bacterium]|nr:NAD-dependent epimerase/dehydratase family protein [bacterium]